MKLVILGVGGMGAITLSKMIAQMAINRGLSVKSSEIHGMAKKGGLVEIQMKIDEGKSGVVLQKEANLVLVFKREFEEYGRAFLKDNGHFVLIDEPLLVDFVNRFGDIRFISSFALGVFLRFQDIFDINDAEAVVSALKDKEKNRKALEEGVKYDF